MEQAGITRSAGVARLAVGLAQGLMLYLLFRAFTDGTWPATDPYLFAPLGLVLLFIPLIQLVGAGALRPRTLTIWSVVALALLVALALHGVMRADATSDARLWLRAGGEGRDPRLLPNVALVFFAGIMLFVAHSLVAAGDADRRLIAGYASYFDAAWKLAVQLVLSAVFVGLFWGVLWLGTALFELIGITLPRETITKSWFAIPATTLALACAIHVTDVRPQLVRGIRTLKLALLSWLLPLMAAITLAFLASLPFTGLAPLWGTGHAAALLLAVGATLVLLINAAYRDGGTDSATARAFRIAGTAAAVALPVLAAIAAHALWLRIDQHGWTTTRVGAVAVLVVLSCYAVGYGVAAVWRGPWLKRLEATNIVAAYAIVGVLVALFTPIADPARIAVASQVARLEAGRIAVDRFDYGYLRWSGGRYGIEALQRLKTFETGAQAAVVRERAGAALAAARGRPHGPPPTAELVRNIVVYPAGRTLPETFRTQDWSGDARRPWALSMCARGRCDAILVDLNGDGTEEIVLLVTPTRASVVLRVGADGRWATFGVLPQIATCPGMIEALREGRFRRLPAEWSDLEIDGRRLRVGAASEGPVSCP